MTRICSLWSSENFLWKDANWTWAECQLVHEICAIWGQTGIKWKDANWNWAQSDCIPPIPPTPTTPVQRLGVDATTLVQPWLEEPWNPYRAGEEEKKKRLIELVCKVKGQEYREKRKAKDLPITIGDVRMVVKAVANIDLNLKLEE